MKFKQLLLAPALMLGAFFNGVAMAEEKPALPDAPSASAPLNLKPLTPQYSYQDAQGVEFKVLPPRPVSDSPLGDGFVGKIAGYVDRHSNDSQTPFDFAMGYKVKDRFTILAGTTADMRTHSGKYEADRYAMRVMTGQPDWQTRNLRDAMAGGMPNHNRHGGDGFAIGVRIQLGPKR